MNAFEVWLLLKLELMNIDKIIVFAEAKKIVSDLMNEGSYLFWSHEVLHVTQEKLASKKSRHGRNGYRMDA